MGRMNDHNVRYLTSKHERGGHLIDADQLKAYGLLKD